MCLVKYLWTLWLLHYSNSIDRRSGTDAAEVTEAEEVQRVQRVHRLQRYRGCWSTEAVEVQKLQTAELQRLLRYRGCWGTEAANVQAAEVQRLLMYRLLRYRGCWGAEATDSRVTETAEVERLLRYRGCRRYTGCKGTAAAEVQWLLREQRLLKYRGCKSTEAAEVQRLPRYRGCWGTGAGAGGTGALPGWWTQHRGSSHQAGYARPWPRRYDWQWSVVASSHQPCYTNLLLPSASTASRPALSHDRHGSLPRPSSCAQPTRLLQWGPRRYVSVPDRSASIRSSRCSSPCPWSTQVGQRFGRHARQITLAPLPRKGRVQTL